MAELMVVDVEGKHRAVEVLNQLEELSVNSNGASVAVAATAVGAGAVAGGATGAAFGVDDAAEWKEAGGISEDFVREVGGMVQPGHSAVFALARADHPEKIAERFRGYGGKVLRTTLPADAAAKFEKLMQPVAATARVPALADINGGVR